MPRPRKTLEDKVTYWVVVVNHDNCGLPLFLGPAANIVDAPDKAARFHKDDRKGANEIAKACSTEFGKAKAVRMTATWRVYE